MKDERKTDHVRMEANEEVMLAMLEVRIETHGEKHRENLKEI
jgi:hypothetical protein